MTLITHGEFAEECLKAVPSHRTNDVIYFNPSDLDYPVAFNIFERVEAEHRHLVYGMMFSLVRDNLKLFEKARYKKPGVWDKTRGATREAKIEKTLREILKHKLNKYPDKNWGKLLLADLSFIAKDNVVWDDVDSEQVNYIIQMASNLT